jgi:uncharacterized NAD(P)/FAD-binding protein YdhS
MHAKFTIAIIGCGLSGTSLLCQLVNRLDHNAISGRLSPDAIRVIVFEKGSQMGPGMPHNTAFVHPYHITNMCAEHMSIFHDRSGDFQIWMERNRADLMNRFPNLFAQGSDQPGNGNFCNHYPRALVGAYLTDRLIYHVARGTDLGMQIDLHRHTEVVDLAEAPNHVNVQAVDRENGKTQQYKVDRAVFSTGHWFGKSSTKGYFPSPWPADRLLQNIPRGSNVAIIGTSLSAIETALTLTAEGRFVREKDQTLTYQQPQNPRKLTLFSRNGLLPTVRGKFGSYRNQILTPAKITDLLSQKPGQLRLNTLFELFDAELRQAYGQPFDWRSQLDATVAPSERLVQSIATANNGDGPEGEVIWQTILHQVLPFVRELYLSLSIVERKRFEKRFKTPFFIFAAPQPIINAQKLLALLKTDSVHIYRLAKPHGWNRNHITQSYTFDYIDSLGKKRRESYPYVVDARGQQISWHNNPSALVRKLHKTGTIQTTEIRVEGHGTKDGGKVNNSIETYDVGSVWIDPETHAVMQIDTSGAHKPSERIFAVGAMTRGQIINASMAQGLAESANRIVNSLMQ